MRRIPLNGADIEKFTFISGGFSFDDEVLENASKTNPYNKLIQALINTEETIDKSRGIILFDHELPMYYIGYMEYDSDIYLFNVRQATIGYCHINYDKELDKMTINMVDETLLPTDDIKTIFGEDITGTGDITMYRHELIISTGRTSYDETEYKVYLTYYSSNKLEANTPEKLKTLTKANSTTILRGIVLEFANAGVQNASVSGKYSGVTYVGQAGWTLEKSIGGSDGTAITSVSDIVTPI